MNGQRGYDAIIVGGGHNGLIAACYLGLAGRRVLVLEKNETLGGATQSRRVFAGLDARLSVYSYLVSLLPQKIITDLGIAFQTRRRAVASYTPLKKNGTRHGLLISNVSEEATRQSFIAAYGDEREYQGYRKLDDFITIFAGKVWPTLTGPLPSRQALEQRFQTPAERAAWGYLVEKPLAALIEDHLSEDAVRGAVFTDAKIGVPTYPEDPTLLQNRTFLYHTIGQGTGEWRVPVGGMGALVDALQARARGLGVELVTAAEVVKVDPGRQVSRVYFQREGKEQAADARFVLLNCAPNTTRRILPGLQDGQPAPGSVFKINLLLKKLPVLRDGRVSGREAFTGTLHIHEGYQNMRDSYQNAQAGVLMEDLPGEIYCHSLTDPSILAGELQQQGYHTLTLFGLDVPYDWFTRDNAGMRAAVTENYLRSINTLIEGDIRDCLALDARGNPAIEAKTPLDLEASLGLPQGNIFHGNLTWPFAERADEVGAWGVETEYENVLVCGSSAKRGGAVSGIPGHAAAMKVLGERF